MAAAGSTGDPKRRRWFLCTLAPCWLITYITIKDTEAILRCSPGEDGTNGFFVSCFVRRSKAHLSDGETEMATAGRKHNPGAISAKRKLQTEGERDGRRRRKKRK